MPWLAVGYDNKELKDMCVGPEPAMEVLPRLTLTVRRYNDLLDVEGIPTLALYGPDGVLITDEGVYARFSDNFPPLRFPSTAVGNVHEDPAGAGFPWVPPAVKNINSGSCFLYRRLSIVFTCSPPHPSLCFAFQMTSYARSTLRSVCA
jgi:hypothetical protein